MLTPLPTQLTGAKFLADRKAALLADAPRCGKTGSAIMAADYLFAESILVVTTASGRSVWERAFSSWSSYGRPVQVLTPRTTLRPDTRIVIVGWADVANPKMRARLLTRNWSLLVLDESHYGKSFDAKRTQAVLGEMIEDGTRVLVNTSLAHKAGGVWCLSGTPMPNSALDLYPMLRVLAPDRLEGKGDLPDVTTFSTYKKRYVVTKPKKVGPWRWIDVVIGGRNEAELARRLDGFMLLRTQQDVGIRPPVYETFPLIVSDANRAETEAGNGKAILAAARAGDTRALEMHLGPLRRLTGEIKARAVVDAVKEEFNCGLDKIVLAYWHRDVGAILKDGLADFGVVGIDGATPAPRRTEAERRFREERDCRVFLAQIVAAGEAIDLSAADELICVETSLIPKDMAQVALRITNNQKPRLCRVRVASLAGSIDEPLQEILLRKWSTIRKVLAA